MIILCVAREGFRVVVVLMGHFNVRARAVHYDHDGSWIGLSRQRWTPEIDLFGCLLVVFLLVVFLFRHFVRVILSCGGFVLGSNILV
jgi:hypothetical protein